MDAVSFVTASVSMRSHLSFTRCRFEFSSYQNWVVLKTLSKAERFENYTVSLVV